MLPVYAAETAGKSRSIARELTDFPEPDSPTIATVSPWFTEKEISCKTGTRLPSWRKLIFRFCMDKSGGMKRSET